MAASTKVSKFIEGLGPYDVEDTNRLLIACACVVAIARDLHPSEILMILADAFDEDDWHELKATILLRDFEKQLGATTAASMD